MSTFVDGETATLYTIGGQPAEFLLRKDTIGPAGAKLYQMHGYGATTYPDKVEDVVNRNALDCFVKRMRQGSTCYVEHKEEFDNILGITTRDHVIVDCPPGRYGRFYADEPFAALDTLVDISPYSDRAQHVVKEALFGVEVGFSAQGDILYKTLRKSRDGLRVGWEVHEVEPSEITATTRACNPTAWADVLMKSLRRRNVLNNRSIENDYTLTHGQDFDDDVAVMLYQLASFLQRHNLTLPDLAPKGGAS